MDKRSLKRVEIVEINKSDNEKKVLAIPITIKLIKDKKINIMSMIIIKKQERGKEIF